MDNNYKGMAVGVFELDNLVACFVALDAASKAANVRIQSVERNRLKSGACVKMRGSVSDVMQLWRLRWRQPNLLVRLFLIL